MTPEINALLKVIEAAGNRDIELTPEQLNVAITHSYLLPPRGGEILKANLAALNAAAKAAREAREAAAREDETRRAAERAEAFQNAERERALTHWIAQGGDRETFTAEWPGIWRDILKQRTLSALRGGRL